MFKNLKKFIMKVKCTRCGFEWFPSSPKLPKTCASKKCNSPYWNKPYVRSKKKQQNRKVSIKK